MQRIKKAVKFATNAVPALVLGFAPLGAATAAPDDPVQFFVDQSFTHDSNVFRTSRNAISDTRSTTTAGLTFDVPVSRQRFLGEVSVNHNRYSRLDELDFNGRNLRGAWLWQVGEPLSGQLGFSDARRLSSFSNFTPAGRRSDELTARRVYGNAAWMITPSWRLQGGVSEQQYRHDLRRTDDADVRSADMAVSYVSRAENSIGIGWRQDDGNFLHSGNSDFSHQSVGLLTDWAITEKSRINARIDLARRDFDAAGAQECHCTLYRVTYDWRATEKFSLVAEALRDFSPVEDIFSSTTLSKGVSLRPRLVLTEKVALSANVDYSTVDHMGSLRPGRTDHLRTHGATLTYRAMDSLTLSLLLQHEKRTSNVALADYKANLVGIGARLSF